VALASTTMGPMNEKKGTGAALIVVAALAVVQPASGSQSGDWHQVVKLTAPDGGGGDWFGHGVALDGTTALVGAPHHDDAGYDVGAAYAFVESGGSWMLEEKIFPGTTYSVEDFGFALALQGDRALIGAPLCGSSHGLCYVFERTGSDWSEQAQIFPGDLFHGDRQGWSVSLSGDTALVGSPNAEEAGKFRSGSANVYVRDGAGAWVREAELVPGDVAKYANFGYSVSLDGDSALIGRPFEYHTGMPSGAAYVFVRSGSTWSQQAKLEVPDPVGNDNFGWSVAVSGDTAIVGKRTDQSEPGAYVYRRSGTTWGLEARLVGEDTASGDCFGSAVVLQGDRALIGAQAHDESGASSGSAYVFERFGTTWVQRAELFAEDGAPYDFFGSSVALDGERALIGAYRDGGVLDFGSAYVFEMRDAPGAGFCSGDPATGAPCPCGNPSDGSLPGAGCDNGVFASGALLIGSGVASVTGDTLVLQSVHQEPDNSGLYFQGTADLTPGLPWGDGLRCTGGEIVRLQVRFADAAGSSSTTIPIGAAGGVSAGDTRYYQSWYRSVLAPPCGPGVNDFNSSNGYRIVWQP